MEKQKFKTGVILISEMVSYVIEQNPKFANICQSLLNRHIQGDWGNMTDDDIISNDEAIIYGNRIFSSYILTEDIKNLISVDEDKIWIITEADRSSTTLFFPIEY